MLVSIQYSRHRGSPWGGHLVHRGKQAFLLEMVKILAESSGSTCIIAGNLQRREKSNKIVNSYVHQNQHWRIMLKRFGLMVRRSILSLMRLVFVKLKVKIRQLQEIKIQKIFTNKSFHIRYPLSRTGCINRHISGSAQ